MLSTAQSSDTLPPQKRLQIQRWVSANALLLLLALLKFLVHLLTGANYGFFRDELYYIDAGQHISGGYVEFPAFIGLLAGAIHALFGNTLLAYHFFPALTGALLVFFTGLIARELGGGRFAQCLAALASLSALTFLGIDAIFSMDSFDELWWVLAVFCLIRLIRKEQPRYWLLFGLIAGVGLLTKLTIVMFGFAIVAGLLLTPERKYLAKRWPWLGGGIALLFLLPYLLWNATNGWPTLEFWGSYGSGHANPAEALNFLIQQILTMNPLTLPLWLTGLCAFFFTRQLKPYRVLGWAFIILFFLFLLTHAKLYFLSPAYPMLFAAGAILFERLFQTRFWRWTLPIYMLLILFVAARLAPYAVPILPPGSYASTMAFMGQQQTMKVEDRQTSILPQQLADRFGWDTMERTVASAFHQLSPADQAQACILTGNYGEAGALNLYGPADHLPRAISGHNTYYLWGPGNCNGRVLLVIGYSLHDLTPDFSSITQSGLITCTYCMPAENNLPVYICRGINGTIHDLWKRVKHYD